MRHLIMQAVKIDHQSHLENKYEKRRKEKWIEKDRNFVRQKEKESNHSDRRQTKPA